VSFGRPYHWVGVSHFGTIGAGKTMAAGRPVSGSYERSNIEAVDGLGLM
jgi:hypothetical protein